MIIWRTCHNCLSTFSSFKVDFFFKTNMTSSGLRGICPVLTVVPFLLSRTGREAATPPSPSSCVRYSPRGGRSEPCLPTGGWPLVVRQDCASSVPTEKRQRRWRVLKDLVIHLLDIFLTLYFYFFAAYCKGQNIAVSSKEGCYTLIQTFQNVKINLLTFC